MSYAPLKCKACGKTCEIDFELCNVCIEWVYDYNRDLEEDTNLLLDLDNIIFIPYSDEELYDDNY